MDFLANIVNCRDLREYDCFVLAVFSHGEHNEVEFVDGNKVDVDEGVTRRRTESVNAHTEAISVPSCSFYDMKICYSSLPSDAEEESW